LATARLIPEGNLIADAADGKTLNGKAPSRGCPLFAKLADLSAHAGLEIRAPLCYTRRVNGNLAVKSAPIFRYTAAVLCFPSKSIDATSRLAAAGMRASLLAVAAL